MTAYRVTCSIEEEFCILILPEQVYHHAPQFGTGIRSLSAALSALVYNRILHPQVGKHIIVDRRVHYIAGDGKVTVIIHDRTPVDLRSMFIYIISIISLEFFQAE
ncbi:hypothetical protein D9M68_600010 [compost metagenome]